MASDAARVARRANISAVVLVAVSAVLILAAGIGLGRVLWHADPWAPLGPYPTQHITGTDRNSDDVPIVSLSAGTVNVTGRKCATEGVDTIAGWVAWQSLDPRGTSIRTGEGTRPGEPGCVQFSYVNEIPGQVAEIMGRQLDTGEHPTWRIVGVETPSSAERGEGVPLGWATEPFLVVP